MFELTKYRNVRGGVGNDMIIETTSISFDMADVLEVWLLAERHISCIAVFFAYFIIIHGKDPAPFNIFVVRVTFEIHEVLCHCLIENILQVLPM